MIAVPRVTEVRHMTMYPDQSRTTRPLKLAYGTDNKVVFNFFNAVYAWMAVGLAVTAAAAWFVSQSQLVYMTGGRAFGVAFLLGAAVLSFAIQGAAMRLSAAAATGLFI